MPKIGLYLLISHQTGNLVDLRNKNIKDIWFGKLHMFTRIVPVGYEYVSFVNIADIQIKLQKLRIYII